MNRGIIYITTTAVPGLIKIGKTASNNFNQRMYDLEHNGYRNVTALKRAFAIEVDDYSEKEALLHTIFAKSQVGDTELFALDKNIAIQLLSSFEGTVIYPENETKDEIFDEATDNANNRFVPNGEYYFERKKKSDGKTVIAKAIVEDGKWTILKDSVLGIAEDVGVSNKAKKMRKSLPIDSNGKLLENFEMGECSPSFAGEIVMNQSISGWTAWKTKNDKPIDIFRKENEC